MAKPGRPPLHGQTKRNRCSIILTDAAKARWTSRKKSVNPALKAGFSSNAELLEHIFTGKLRFETYAEMTARLAVEKIAT